MRTLCTAVALAVCSSSALAADFGIGVSARSDDAWIYAPINIGQSFRLEPSVRFVSSELSTTSTSERGLDDFRKQETDSLEVGLGIFGLAKIAEAAHIYYGGRFAYVDSESTVTETQTFFPGFSDVLRSETSQDGYRAGPALGFEYKFGQHFSVGGEVSYTFLDIEGESSLSVDGEPSDSRVAIEQKTNGTTTQLIFRYIF